jgi:hypothetical protein
MHGQRNITKEFYMYSFPNIIQVTRKWKEVGGSRGMCGEKRCVYRVMVRKSAGRPPGSTERKLENNIKIDSK